MIQPLKFVFFNILCPALNFWIHCDTNQKYFLAQIEQIPRDFTDFFGF
ncbi:MAG: hypothetical protein RLZZ628_1835 [Bacteroidota bacterium]|jgi:hypothetical protein